LVTYGTNSAESTLTQLSHKHHHHDEPFAIPMPWNLWIHPI
jgi:hypothetical protein